MKAHRPIYAVPLGQDRRLRARWFAVRTWEVKGVTGERGV
jgi:hypothetical protein